MKTWKLLRNAILGLAVLGGIVYLADDLLFQRFEVGGVAVPHPPRVADADVDHPEQHWTADQARWFHHASQGTKILPYEWFLALEQPSLSPLHTPGRIADEEYLRRFGFLYEEASGTTPAPASSSWWAGTPGPGPVRLPIGFAIEEEFRAPYAKPPWSGKVVGLTCAACHTGQITYRDRASGRLKAVRIEGGSAMIALAQFQDALGRALAYTRRFGARFERFARAVLKDTYADPNARAKLERQVDAHLAVGFAMREYSRARRLSPVELGFSRTDALGLIGNRVFGALGEENQIVIDAPVNFPHLWGTAWFDWVQYNASIRLPLVRNIGEALGVGAAVNVDPFNGSKLFASTINVKNLHAMEDQLGGRTTFAGLRAPQWPAGLLPPIDAARRDRGAALYRQHCQGCHLPPMAELVADAGRAQSKYPALQLWDEEAGPGRRILRLKTADLQVLGTDPNQAVNFYQRFAAALGETVSATRGLYVATEFIRREKFRELGLTAEEIREYDRYRTFHDQATGREVFDGKFMREVIFANLKYRARPLDGVWATPPFLHNSSVPNLYQLLLPASRRDAVFFLGTTRYDPVHVGYETGGFPNAFRMDTTKTGSSNAGHEYRNLTLEELELFPNYRPLPGAQTVRGRWARILGVSEDEFGRLSAEQRWKRTRAVSREVLRSRWAQFHPIKGVLGVEFTDPERWDLVEYMKSL